MHIKNKQFRKIKKEHDRNYFRISVDSPHIQVKYKNCFSIIIFAEAHLQLPQNQIRSLL